MQGCDKNFIHLFRHNKQSKGCELHEAAADGLGWKTFLG